MKDELVYRSFYLFEKDDAELSIISARCGSTRGEMIRGIIHLKIKKWTDCLKDSDVAPAEFLKELQEIIDAGKVEF